MGLNGKCYYPYQTNIRERKFIALRHRGPEIQSRRHGGTFVGLDPQTKFQPPNWNVKH